MPTLERARAAASMPTLRDEPRTQTNAHAGLGLGLIALGFGLAVNSLLGPVVAGAFDFHVTETLLDQMIGLDAVSLVVVAPLSVAAGVLALRGHVAGPALALGP